MTQIDDHPTCPTCKYDLHGLAGDPVRCPECGATHARAMLVPHPPSPDIAMRVSLPFAIVSSVALWIWICLATGKSEAWDAFWPWYSGVAGLNGLFAAIAPRRFWIWPPVIGLSPLVALFASGPGGLWPLGVIMFLVLSVPMFLPALIGVGIRRLVTR